MGHSAPVGRMISRHQPGADIEATWSVNLYLSILYLWAYEWGDTFDKHVPALGQVCHTHKQGQYCPTNHSWAV